MLKIIYKLTIIFLNILYLYMFLLTLASSRDLLLSANDKDIYFASLIIAIVILILIFVVYYLYHIKTKINILFNQNKKIIISYFISFLLALTAPLYVLNLENYQNVVSRADYRFSEGKWNEAMTIYILLGFRLETPKPQIKEMQEILNKLGYYDFPIDGRPHFNIIKHLKEFQSQNNLNADGYFGKDTRTLAYGIIFKEKLKIFNSNITLDQVQDAVKEFQALNKLSVDGNIGNGTLEKLNHD